MWNNKKVSVVFGTYREKKSIRAAIEDFLASGYVDEVVVVNNNAEAGTDEEVKKTSAKLVHEKKQGMGHSFRRGIEETSGDFVILAEPDGTFVGSDLERFLVYAKDFPIVLGSRTNQNSIYKGVEMGFSRKWANVLEAKIIEVLFATNSLTDVGCHFKLLSREAVKKLSPAWNQGGSLFPVEIILSAVTSRTRFIEIPITFRKRVGKSAVIKNDFYLIWWGIRILWFILIFWLIWAINFLRNYFKK